jgi:PAS domain S-box-containing protein
MAIVVKPVISTPTKKDTGPESVDRSVDCAALEAEVVRLRHRAALLTIERDIARSLGAAQDLDTGLRQIVPLLQRIESVDCGGVYLVDPETHALELAAQVGLASDFAQRVARHGAASAHARLVERGEPTFNIDPALLPAWEQQGLIEQGIRATAVLPIAHEEETVAALVVSSKAEMQFSGEVRSVLNDIVVYLGGAIARLKAEAASRQNQADLQARQKFLRGSTEIISTALTASDSREMMQRLTDELNTLFEASNCYLVLWDATRRRAIPTAATGEWRERYPQIAVDPSEPTLTATVLEAGRSLTINNSRKNTFVSERIAGLFPTESILALPLMAEKRKLGAILIAFDQQHTFTDEEVAAGEFIAGQISLALYKTRLLEEVHARYQEAETLREAALAVTTSLKRDEVVRRILVQLQKVVPYDTASVQLLEGDRLTIVGGYGYPNHDKIMGLTFDVGAEAAGDNPNRQVIQTRAPVIVPDGPTEYAGFRREPHAQANIRAWLGVPMQVGDRLIGMITLDKSEPDFYTPRHAHLAEAFAAQAAAAMENSLLYERARREIAERKRAEAALQASEAMYRAQIEQSQDGIAVMQRGQFVLLNPKVEALFGVTLADTRDPNFRIIDFIAPHDREQIFTELLETDWDQIPVPQTEFTALNRAGEEIEVEVTRSPVSYGGETAVQIVIRDITERKRMAERLRQQERLAALGQLSGGIAHELRSILTTIILYAELDLTRQDLPPRVAQHLHTIVGESRKAADLTQQVLDFSSNSMLKPSPVDVPELVREGITRARSELPEQIETEVITADGAIIINADSERIEQAIHNLITNARDAMPDGGMIRCEVTRQQIAAGETTTTPGLAPGAWVRVAVTDTGVGITDDVREHLFEPFFTTKEVGQGRGLGLAQVYGIVRQHGGVVDVQSAPGDGTTVHLYFPAPNGDLDCEPPDGS